MLALPLDVRRAAAQEKIDAFRRIALDAELEVLAAGAQTTRSPQAEEARLRYMAAKMEERANACSAILALETWMGEQA